MTDILPAPVPFPLTSGRLASVLTGPTGLGTSAVHLATRLTELGRPLDVGHDPDPAYAERDPDPAYAERPWGDGTAPPLYCPVVHRRNDALGDEVDARLVAWARECGFRDHELDLLRQTRFGRLMMLAHAGSDDPDRLLIAAKMNFGWWAADDLYADNTDLGAEQAALPPRLALGMAAMDPVPPVRGFTDQLNAAIEGERVLVALRSAVDYLARYGTPAQVQRACYSTFTMFMAWTAYAAWRHQDRYPPAWEYLATRQHDSFYTSMTVIDVVDGYELPANIFYEPRVRRAAIQAGTATVLVNDLYSVTKDLADENPPCNMVLQVAADRGCSIAQATEVVVGIHNDLVRDFQAAHRNLQAVPSPELQRFLRGLRAWMGGSAEWHATSPRYQ